MATRYFCDRCDAQTPVLKQVPIPPSGVTNYNDGKQYELCGNCVLEIHKFLEPLPKEVRND